MTTPVAAPLPIDFKLRPAAARGQAAQATDQDRYRMPADDARFSRPTRQEPSRDAVRDLIRTDAYDSRPATMGPLGRRGAGWHKPAKGVTVGAEVGDGWRLEGTASPKHKGTLRVGLSRKF